MWYKNIAGRFFVLVTKHACERRTDGQNYDSQDRASMASRGENSFAIFQYLNCGGLASWIFESPDYFNGL